MMLSPEIEQPELGEDLRGPVNGLEGLWKSTRGDPRVVVAVVDGPVDRSHPAFDGAELVDADGPGDLAEPSSRIHGTFVASLIFGQHRDGLPFLGVAPRCRGLILPVFRDEPGGGVVPCSQVELAMAIARAAASGARVINISAGEPIESGPSPMLVEAVEACRRQGVLIVAAAGNDGRDRLHVPASMPGVLAVGAMDGSGFPLQSSNWHRHDRSRGLIAPGSEIPGAIPGGLSAAKWGTSFASALVSGVAALLMSLAIGLGRPIGGAELLELLVETADGCPLDDHSVGCSRSLAGRLDLGRAVAALRERCLVMTHDGPRTETIPSTTRPGGEADPSPASRPAAADSIRPAACGCGSGGGCGCAACGAKGLVFAQGQIGYDLLSEARRDSIHQHMDGDSPSPSDRGQMLAYLDANPWEASSISWTLNFDQTPIYAIAPQGPFAGEAYARLRRFLAEQQSGEIERISVAGVVSGKVTLLSGVSVPVIVPEIRGLASWTTVALARAAAGEQPAEGGSPAEVDLYHRKVGGVRNLLDRVYHELRNFGLAPRDRALNYAATNALLVGEVFESAVKDEAELDIIDVERSSICRAGADCWDVTMTFFFPRRPWQASRKSYRFTVDVSDVVPVMVGPIRSWSLR